LAAPNEEIEHNLPPSALMSPTKSQTSD